MVFRTVKFGVFAVRSLSYHVIPIRGRMGNIVLTIPLSPVEEFAHVTSGVTTALVKMLTTLQFLFLIGLIKLSQRFTGPVE